MEKEDHLDKETGFSLTVSEAGFSVKAKSRIISAADRWGGNWLRKKSFKGERTVQTDEQLIQLEAKIVKIAGEKLLNRVESDDELAMQVLNIAYSREARRREHKEGVILACLEILKADPVSEADSDIGPEILSDEFLDRVERFAEDASTDELQQRWGRILAGEIRKPGTFNRKVLRAVDELDPMRAAAFESLAQYGIGDTIFRVLTPKTTYNERVHLFSSGLFSTAEESQVRYFFEATLGDSRQIWLLDLHDYAIGFSKDIVPNYGNEAILMKYEDKPSVPIFLLTDVGAALLEIIKRDEKKLIKELAEEIKTVLPEGAMRYYRRSADKHTWIDIGSFDNI